MASRVELATQLANQALDALLQARVSEPKKVKRLEREYFKALERMHNEQRTAAYAAHQ